MSGINTQPKYAVPQSLPDLKRNLGMMKAVLVFLVLAVACGKIKMMSLPRR